VVWFRKNIFVISKITLSSYIIPMKETYPTWGAVSVANNANSQYIIVLNSRLYWLQFFYPVFGGCFYNSDGHDNVQYSRMRLFSAWLIKFISPDIEFFYSVKDVAIFSLLKLTVALYPVAQSLKFFIYKLVWFELAFSNSSIIRVTFCLPSSRPGLRSGGI